MFDLDNATHPSPAMRRRASRSKDTRRRRSSPRLVALAALAASPTALADAPLAGQLRAQIVADYGVGDEIDLDVTVTGDQTTTTAVEGTTSSSMQGPQFFTFDVPCQLEPDAEDQGLQPDQEDQGFCMLTMVGGGLDWSAEVDAPNGLHFATVTDGSISSVTQAPGCGPLSTVAEVKSMAAAAEHETGLDEGTLDALVDAVVCAPE